MHTSTGSQSPHRDPREGPFSQKVPLNNFPVRTGVKRGEGQSSLTLCTWGGSCQTDAVPCRGRKSFSLSHLSRSVSVGEPNQAKGKGSSQGPPPNQALRQELTPLTFVRQTPLTQLRHSLVRVPGTGRWSTLGANPNPFVNLCQDPSTLDLVYWDTALK